MNPLMLSWLPMAMVMPRIVYAIPLIITISLVYGATRHENMSEIFEQSIRSIIWIVTFMAVILAMIWLGGFWN